MILDKQTEFSSAQVVTATAVSTNVLDLGSARRIGDGENINILTVVDVAMTDVGSDSTITVELITDDNAAMSSPTLIQTLGVFPALSAVAAKLIARIAQDLPFERYIAVRYTATGGSLSTGSFSSVIVKDVDAGKTYPRGYTISTNAG